MGKAAKLKQARRLAGPDPHLPTPGDLLAGTFDRQTNRAAIPRRANFWRELGGRRAQCDLCFKACVLKPGEAGWCGYRGNDGGRISIPEHGTLARAQRLMLAYRGGLRTFDPGARAVGVGGIRCTARCSFCVSAALVWRPERLAWLGGQERHPGTDLGWNMVRAMQHPAGVVALARQWGATHVVFAENEPLLSFEYTHDTARLAREAGLKVVLYTNGFSEPAVIRAIAPYVDAVDLGVKGSLDPGFYARYMRSPGGAEAVKRALLTWREAGVYLLISDLIATPHQQADAVADAAQAACYAWVAAELGAHTPLLLGLMHAADSASRMLVPRTEERYAAYFARYQRAKYAAFAAGLVYAHRVWEDERIDCHACGGLLLQLHRPSVAVCRDEHDRSDSPCRMHTTGCDCWSHTQHVTDGHCDHCGVPVPIVTLPAAELAAFRATIAGNHPA